MKSISWRLGLAAACAALTMFGRATPALAAEQDRGGPADRLERLERRVNEMAQRQEQLMRRLGAQQERQAPMAAPGRRTSARGWPCPSARGWASPCRRTEPPRWQPCLRPQDRPLGWRSVARGIAGLVMLCLLVAFVFNILLAVWIFTDIRKRGEGSGIFIALALLAGIPAAIIYSLVRIGDKKP